MQFIQCDVIAIGIYHGRQLIGSCLTFAPDSGLLSLFATTSLHINTIVISYHYPAVFYANLSLVCVFDVLRIPSPIGINSHSAPAQQTTKTQAVVPSFV